MSVTLGPKNRKGDKGDAGDRGPKGAKGEAGKDGEQGLRGVSGMGGSNGVGVPTGGTLGQVLAKIDGDDYNTEWITNAAADTGITQLIGDITAGPGSGSQAATLVANAVTNAKLADVATATFKGRTTGGTGDPEDLTVAQAKTLLNLTGTNSGDQTITLTGAVTGSGTGSFATTLASGIDATKLADGSVTSAEFQFINSLTSNVQTQLDSKIGFTFSAISSNTNAVSGTTYKCNTSGGAFTLTLPIHVAGQFVGVIDSNGTFNTNNLTIARNGGTGSIQRVGASYICFQNEMNFLLVDDGTDWFLMGGT